MAVHICCMDHDHPVATNPDPHSDKACLPPARQGITARIPPPGRTSDPRVHPWHDRGILRCNPPTRKSAPTTSRAAYNDSIAAGPKDAGGPDTDAVKAGLSGSVVAPAVGETATLLTLSLHRY